MGRWKRNKSRCYPLEYGFQMGTIAFGSGIAPGRRRWDQDVREIGYGSGQGTADSFSGLWTICLHHRSQQSRGCRRKGIGEEIGEPAEINLSMHQGSPSAGLEKQ